MMNTFSLRRYVCLAAFLLLFTAHISFAADTHQNKIFVLTERGGQHEAFVVAGLQWLEKFCQENSMQMDVYQHADVITSDFLAQYAAFIQLNYPPYTWPETAVQAFEQYIEKGNGGGWIGFHHATLLGEFDGYPIWNWFSNFMGGIRFQNYIAELVAGTVAIEDSTHPVMQGVPSSFVVTNEEWYTYDKNPRPNVHVLAGVDENSYTPSSEVKMGDHPVVWTNDKMGARNVYIFMGHHPDLFSNAAYTQMLHNAILWTAGR